MSNEGNHLTQIISKAFQYPGVLGSIDSFLEGVLRSPDDDLHSLRNQSLARFAVDEHNKKENAQLEFARLVRVKESYLNAAGSREFLLTLEVIDAGKRKTYEAEVLWKPLEDFKELQKFRLVGDSTYDPADPAPFDLGGKLG